MQVRNLRHQSRPLGHELAARSEDSASATGSQSSEDRFHTGPATENLGILTPSLRAATPTISPRRSAASRLLTSGHELARLVSTHPTEYEELSTAYQQLSEFVGQTLFGGTIPGDIPLAPADKPVRPPAEAGGMTGSEQMAMNHLVSFYREASALMPSQQHHKKLVLAMHQVQNQLMGRVLRRDYPDFYLSIPGSLEADQQQEDQRWRGV